LFSDFILSGYNTDQTHPGFVPGARFADTSFHGSLLKISDLFDEQVYITGVGYAGVDTVQQLSSKSFTALLNNDQYGKRYVDDS
jgi:hypothetical protein